MLSRSVDKQKINMRQKGGFFIMKNFLNDFKAFAFKGNIVDMAVGVIIGSAFGKIVNSLVADIVMPLIGVLIGGTNFTGLAWQVGNANVTYGNFIQTIVEFLIIAFSIFCAISLIGKIFKKRDEEDKEPEAPKKSDEVVLLEEIRDLLKK